MPEACRMKLLGFVAFIVILHVINGLAVGTSLDTKIKDDAPLIPWYLKSEEDCEPLPSLPPEEDGPELDLLYLLTRGTEFLQNYTDTVNATLLLGNTGAGKSTVAQIIAGDLTKLHAVLAPGDQLVIIDDDNRIGLPSTKSKTLIPELVIKNDNDTSLAFYDCPGFDDTRGPVQDIAANFFMNQVSGRITNVKMLFLVIYSSVKLGNDRVDFDKLAKHATTFVKNIEKYTKSLGLLVTKVDSYNNRGQYIEDHVIIEQIVGFLKTYNDTLYSDLVSGSDEDNEIISKKIIFVESLLEQELATGNYSKIWFVRSPLECGPLSEMQMIRDTRNNITALYEQLVSTKVDTENDFGFTLKDSSLLNIANYTATINTGIANVTNIVMKDLQKQYFQLKIDPKIEDFELEFLFSQMKNSSFELTTIIEDLTTNTSSLEDFLKNSKKVWTILEDILPNKFDIYMRWQEEYLLFFDKATNKKQDRLFKIWAAPFVSFQETYTKHVAWYEFCLQLEVKTSSYEFHSQNLSPPSSIDPYNWLDYIISQDLIYVSDQVLNAYKSMRKSDVEALNSIMSFSLKVPDFFCLASQKAFIVHSNFIRIQDILPHIQTCSNELSRLEIYASHTIFMDVNLTLYDADVVIIAPLMQNPGQFQNNLLLAGSSAYRHDISWFSRNTTSLGHDGEDGEPGRAGMPGNPGGTVFAVVGSIVSKTPIVLTSQGGDGSNGEKGGEGESHKDDCNSPDCHICNGGHGGDGGKGGKKGLASEVTFVDLQKSSDVLRIEKPGSDGSPGLGGNGGVGVGSGKYGDHVVLCTCYNNGFPNFKQLCIGRVGVAGASEVGLTNPAPPRVLTKYSYLLYYVVKFFSYTKTQTVNFFQDMDTSGQLKPYGTLKALAEESLALETIDKSTINQNRLAEVFNSLITKLNTFYTENYNSSTKEQKKVLKMLQSSSYISYIRLKSPLTLPLISDVPFYCNIRKQQIQFIKRASVYNATISENNKFTNDLIAKIIQTTNLTQLLISNAIDRAGSEMEFTMAAIQQNLIELIQDENRSLEDCKIELKLAEMKKGAHKFVKLFEFVTKIASVIFPGVKTWSQLSTMLTKLETQFSDQPNELDRLQKLKAEIEKFVEELDEQQDKFEVEFIPVVESFFAYVRNLRDSLTSGNEIVAPFLPVPKSLVIRKLKGCKSFLADLAESSIITKASKHAFDRVQDVLLLSMELSDIIDGYLDTKSLANHINTFHSPEIYPEPIKDGDLARAVARFEPNAKRNLFDQEVKKAMHAFKQWVFPFAKFYSLEWISSETGDEQVEEVERLQFHLENYKENIVGEHDTFIIQMNFSSGHKSTKPFYSWEKEEWDEEINLLFSGLKVHFNADIRLHGMEGWDAIKFKHIEINFKLNAAASELQAEFDDLIEYFGISMTHSGVSYFRFDQEYYVMTGFNQTLLYNFEVDVYGNRLGTNQVYEKFKRGDCMLSPYTLWTVQLVNVIPTRKLVRGKVLRDDVSYESLKKFIPHIEIELVGVGTYVKADEALAAAGGDLQLDNWYERDITLKNDYMF